MKLRASGMWDVNEVTMRAWRRLPMVTLCSRHVAKMLATRDGETVMSLTRDSYRSIAPVHDGDGSGNSHFVLNSAQSSF